MARPFEPPHLRQPSSSPRSVVAVTMRTALIIGLLALVFGAGLVAGRYRTPPSTGAAAAPELENAANFAILEETWRVIQEDYVDLANVDEDALIYGASEGMVEALGDTGHSRFLDPDDAKVFSRSMSGRRIGVGIRLEQVGAQVVVAGVIPGTPAESAAIEQGDVIIAVDGQELDRLSRNEISDLFQGEEGTLLNLTLVRGSEPEPFDLSVERELLDIEPVIWGMLPDDVGLIHISEFSAGAADGLQKAIEGVRERGATAIVLDLRDNPGGLVFEAVAVASQFLPEDAVIFEQRQRDGSVNTFEAMPNGVALDLPVVVLINEGSASAAEIVAGALRDNDRARLLGERTFGTGTVLSPVELEDGSLVVIGTGLWLTPDGQTIWKEGVDPDREIDLDVGIYPLGPEDDSNISPRELVQSEDDQLRAAQEEASRLGAEQSS